MSLSSSLITKFSRTSTIPSLCLKHLTYNSHLPNYSKSLSFPFFQPKPPQSRPFTQQTIKMTAIPKTMSGVIISNTGGTEVLEYRTDLPVPVPKEGEVLVKNEFIGVNYIDTYFRSGLYPAPLPLTLGREASGTIISQGPNTPSSLPVGARVVFLSGSSYAEYTSTPTTHVALIPSHITSHTAAATLLQGLTALTLIRETHTTQLGEWTFVHAAAGGTGLWLCRLLRATGVKVIGTASTAGKRELAKAHGADFVLDSTASHDSLISQTKEITGEKLVSVVFDGVGKATFDLDLELLARKGTLVSFGNASGAVPPVTISRLTPKNLKLLRPSLNGYIVTREEFEKYTEELWRLLGTSGKEGGMVEVHEVYPLSEVKRAHEDLEGRGTTGKLLLRP